MGIFKVNRQLTGFTTFAPELLLRYYSRVPVLYFSLQNQMLVTVSSSLLS